MRQLSKDALSKIRASSRDFLTPAEAAAALGCDPQALRVQARQDPSKLGFPVIVIKTRTKIPRRPFLEYIGG